MVVSSQSKSAGVPGEFGKLVGPVEASPQTQREAEEDEDEESITRTRRNVRLFSLKLRELLLQGVEHGAHGFDVGGEGFSAGRGHGVRGLRPKANDGFVAAD